MHTGPSLLGPRRTPWEGLGQLSGIKPGRLGSIASGLSGPPGPGVRDRGLTSDLSESQITGSFLGRFLQETRLSSAVIPLDMQPLPSDLCVIPAIRQAGQESERLPLS